MSRATRRIWWVLVSLSYSPAEDSARLTRMDNHHSQPAVTQSCSPGAWWRAWRCFQRSPHSSPRRAPIVIASHTSGPRYPGTRQAAFMMRAASSAVGGCGSGGGAAGTRTSSTGL